MTVLANRHGLGLCFRLADGLYSIPLSRVRQLTGFATLTGEPEDYFLGWLSLHGEPVPVFDLNRVVCDQTTPENFGSRIIVVEASAASPTACIGLLAGGVTDTIETGNPEPGQPDTEALAVEPLPLDSYLPMLYSMIPPVPATI